MFKKNSLKFNNSEIYYYFLKVILNISLFINLILRNCVMSIGCENFTILKFFARHLLFYLKTKNNTL